MKLVVCLLLVAPLVVEANRSKRFAALATGIGGAAGCVVTGNQLFANGFFLRNLTSSEQSELSNYQSAMKDYKEQLKAALEKRRDQLKNRLSSGRGPTSDGTNSNSVIGPNDFNQNQTHIEPPTRPSFCDEATTTQYYFDGCMVQNDKVYVGKTFARDLTPDEIQQLNDFDVKMTAYQKQVQSDIQKQMQGMFGGKDFFASLFGQASSNDDATTQATVESTTSAQAKLEAPQAPQFCTAI